LQFSGDNIGEVPMKLILNYSLILKTKTTMQEM